MKEYQPEQPSAVCHHEAGKMRSPGNNKQQRCEEARSKAHAKYAERLREDEPYSE